MPKLTPGQRAKAFADAANRTNVGYAAALVILDWPYFRERRDIWNHVHPATHTIRWDDLLDGCAWSTTERILLDAARAFYCGHGTFPSLYEVVDMLDDDQFALVMRAAAVRRGSNACRAIIA